jgi:DNA replication protein DnaC
LIPAEIRRLFFGEHWKVGTIAAQLGLHHETVRQPTALTTNLAFKDWTTVFPHATCTIALVDRITHRADIIKIEGNSWRRKEAQERQARNR